MVDQTNIFEGSEQQADQSGAQSEGKAFELPETVSEFIGEGKKYSDVGKALESIPHAQTHIQKLEQEMAEMKARLDAQASVEETLKRYAGQKVPETPTSQPIDPSDIDRMIEQRLSAQEQQRRAQSNISEVVDTLANQFGGKDKAEQAFVQKAQELGMDVNVLNNLAATSPQAVYNLFGSQAKPKSSMSKTSVNLEAIQASRPTEAPKPKSVMFGASSQEMVEAFRAAAATVNTGD